MSDREDALKWAASVLDSEARWQWEMHGRGALGAHLIAQRVEILRAVILDEAHRAASEAARGGMGSRDGASEVAAYQRDPCQPHPSPAGPNEDVGQCAKCFAPIGVMRPEGEEFGLHDDDCSLEQRHRGACVGGGIGHPPAPVVRGYWGPTTEADIAAARARWSRP